MSGIYKLRFGILKLGNSRTSRGGFSSLEKSLNCCWVIFEQNMFDDTQGYTLNYGNVYRRLYQPLESGFPWIPLDLRPVGLSLSLFLSLPRCWSHVALQSKVCDERSATSAFSNSTHTACVVCAVRPLEVSQLDWSAIGSTNQTGKVDCTKTRWNAMAMQDCQRLLAFLSHVVVAFHCLSLGKC